jgi:hypothetical protein
VTSATTDAYQKIPSERLKVQSEFMVGSVVSKYSQLITMYHNPTEIPLPATPSKQVIIAEPKESELNLVSEHNFVMLPRKYHFETDETYFHTESIRPFCMNVAH